MLDTIIETITAYQEYSIPGILLLIFAIISIISPEFYRGIKKLLIPATVIWLGCVGFHYFNGYSLYSYISKSTKVDNENIKEEGAFGKYYKLEGVDDIK